MLIQSLERVRADGSVDRMMALADKLGIVEADVAHLPHQIAAEIAEGCIWDEELWARYDKREYQPDKDWHAKFAAEADIATITGLEGIVAYLLCQLWEESVAKLLHRPHRTAGVSPEEAARRMRLKLWADATFL